MPEISLERPEPVTTSCFEGYSDTIRRFAVSGIDELDGEILQGEMRSYVESRSIVIGYLCVSKSFPTEEDTYWGLMNEGKAKALIEESIPALTQQCLKRNIDS